MNMNKEKPTDYIRRGIKFAAGVLFLAGGVAGINKWDNKWEETHRAEACERAESDAPACAGIVSDPETIRHMGDSATVYAVLGYIGVGLGIMSLVGAGARPRMEPLLELSAEFHDKK